MSAIDIDSILREVCERLAPIDKAPCSAGEREAAEWIAARLERAGVADVLLEDEPSWSTFPPTGPRLGLRERLPLVLRTASERSRRPVPAWR